MMKPRLLKIADSCTGCGSCVNICPKGCLSLEPDQDGFYYPVFNALNCINCGLCDRTCHVVTLNDHHSPEKGLFFLYQSKDVDLLQSSSSGGAFTLLAEWVLEHDGVVFGSRYNEKTERLEVFNTDQTSLSSLRKSKYVESFTGRSFSLIREYLKKGRRVLYCGTPCQVRGLKQFLTTVNEDTSLLLTVDFACHGVPSNLCFTEFKHMFENKKRKMINVDFRWKDFSQKEMQWHDMTLKMDFTDGSSLVLQRYDYYYYYYQPFYENLSLRKSCYHCNIAIQSDADFSLGDFWGINKYRKELDNNRGMSFVCVNNENCLTLWNELSQNGFMEPLPYDAIAYQYVDRRKTRELLLSRRDVFFEAIREVGFIQAVERQFGGKWKLMKMVYLHRLIMIVKRIIKRS